jgi:ABC-type transporter Mla subunit MlaD
MHDERLHMIIGLILLPLIVAGVIAVLIVGDRPLRPSVHFSVEFDYVGQLSPGSKVKMANMEIGKIKHISFHDKIVNGKQVRRVRAYIWIYRRHQHQVYRNSKAFIASASLIGERHLELAAPDNAPGITIQPGDVLQGKSASYLDRFLALSYQNLVVAQELADTIAPHWKRMTQGLDSVEKELERLRKHETRIRILVKRAETAAQDARGSYRTLQAATDDFRAVRRLEYKWKRLARRTRQGVGPLVKDVERLIHLLDTLAVVMNKRVPPAVKLMRTRADRIAARFKHIEKWFQVIQKYVETGRGTVGAFLKERELWDDFKASGKVIRQKIWLNITRPKKTSVKGNPALP